MLSGQHDTVGISAPLGKDQLRTMTVPYMVQLRYYLIVQSMKYEVLEGNVIMMMEIMID